jgi:hypothetical protein
LKSWRRIDKLNERLRQRNAPKKQAGWSICSEDCLPRLEKYEQQTQVLAGRTSYSKTDPDASCMRMKEDRGAEKPWPKPAYNVQTGTFVEYLYVDLGAANCSVLSCGIDTDVTFKANISPERQRGSALRTDPRFSTAICRPGWQTASFLLRSM